MIETLDWEMMQFWTSGSIYSAVDYMHGSNTRRENNISNRKKNNKKKKKREDIESLL